MTVSLFRSLHSLSSFLIMFYPFLVFILPPFFTLFCFLSFLHPLAEFSYLLSLSFIARLYLVPFILSLHSLLCCISSSYSVSHFFIFFCQTDECVFPSFLHPLTEFSYLLSLSFIACVLRLPLCTASSRPTHLHRGQPTFGLMLILHVEVPPLAALLSQLSDF